MISCYALHGKTRAGVTSGSPASSAGWASPSPPALSATFCARLASGLQAGASDYAAKPVDIDQILSVMRVWLRKH